MLTGSRIVVTGAAGGIGLGVLRHLVGLGADVVGLDLSDAVPETVGDAGARGIRCDITDPAAVTEALTTAWLDGPVHGLVTAAGIHRPAPFLEMSLAQFEAIQRVNVHGTVIPAQLVARRMAESGTGGSIVTLASIAADHVTPVSTAYATSKGAVVSFTRGAAMSLAQHGIRVNGIAPGPVDTPMNAERRKDPAYMARMIERVPMGRQGTVADIAAAAAFLLDEHSTWITGEILHVDGGISVLR